MDGPVPGLTRGSRGADRPDARPGAERQRLRRTVRALDTRGVPGPPHPLRRTASVARAQRVRDALPYGTEPSGPWQRFDCAGSSRGWSRRDSLPRPLGRPVALLLSGCVSMGPVFVHYGIVVAVTFVTLLAAAGIRSAPGVLMIPLEREFGWTRATVSFAVSINLFLYGLSGPFIAGLMDRLGIRRVMVTSLALVATGVALTTLMTATWQLALLWGVVVGIGTGAMASVLGAMDANRWFTERRGVVLGLLTASSATGQLLFLPLIASMVVRLGWRSAVLLVAGVALVVLPLVAVLMRDHPRDMGLRPFGESANAPATPRPPRAAVAAPVIGLARGLRSRDFWLLAGSFFICGLSTNGLIGTHLIPASMEHGIPEVMAASLLASIGLLDIIGTTISGWLSDRWDN